VPQPILLGDKPYIIIRIVHLGPLKIHIKSNRYLLLIVDNLEKVSLYDSKSTGTTRIIKRVTEFIDKETDGSNKSIKIKLNQSSSSERSSETS
ncbi:Uncharacterized protein FWK35_00014293, partial [Aphis craccivora]